MAEILDGAGPTSNEEVARFESQAGITLPADYREFLLTHGGGVPAPDTFQLADGSDESFVDQLYYLDKKFDDYGNLLHIRGVFSDVYPEKLVMIGRDPLGNQICLFLSGPRQGAVGLWYHEYGSVQNDQELEEAVKVISGSFAEFLASLYES